jgi:hypothetical protein
LNQKVETVMELRGKTIERERVKAEAEINKTTEEGPPIGKRKATKEEIKNSSGD